MVNPRMLSRTETDSRFEGGLKHPSLVPLAVAPLALAVSLSLPIGFAFADEVADASNDSVGIEQSVSDVAVDTSAGTVDAIESSTPVVSNTTGSDTTKVPEGDPIVVSDELADDESASADGTLADGLDGVFEGASEDASAKTGSSSPSTASSSTGTASESESTNSTTATSKDSPVGVSSSEASVDGLAGSESSEDPAASMPSAPEPSVSIQENDTPRSDEVYQRITFFSEEGDVLGEVVVPASFMQSQSNGVSTFAATDKVVAQVTGVYHQSEARKMLDLVNADRLKTNGSTALTWDYLLEQYAMQRAAELYYYFSHTRPNGDEWSKEVMTYGYYTTGENIHQSMGPSGYQSSAAKANQAWIDSKPHHTNRTKAKWQGYAAACFLVPNGTYYTSAGARTGNVWCWVELFSNPNGDPTYKAPVDGERTVEVVLVGENHKIYEGAVDEGKNPVSLGWYYDEDKDKFTYVRAITYTSYVPMYYGDGKREYMLDGRYYVIDQEGFITKESEKNLPFTREEFLGLVKSDPLPAPSEDPFHSTTPNTPGASGQTPSNPVPGASAAGNTASTRPVYRPAGSSSSSNGNAFGAPSATPLNQITGARVVGAINVAEIRNDWYGGSYYISDTARRNGARWVTENGRRYFRHSNGALVVGWLVDGNKRYYLGNSGAMATGWQRVGNGWFFFDPVTGEMKTGFIEQNGVTYYADEHGMMQTGWFEVDGRQYFADMSGAIREIR